MQTRPDLVGLTQDQLLARSGLGLPQDTSAWGPDLDAMLETLSPDVLERLRQGSVGDRVSMAVSPGCPRAAAAVLVGDVRPVRTALAENPRTPRDLLAVLLALEAVRAVGPGSCYARRQLPERGLLPRLVERLGPPVWLEWVYNIPADLCGAHSYDTDLDSLALLPVFRILGGSGPFAATLFLDEEVPAEVVRAGVVHPDFDVRYEALGRVRTPFGHEEGTDWGLTWEVIRPGLLMLPRRDWAEILFSLSQDTIRDASVDPEPDIRTLAARSTTDVSVLRTLARDPVEEVRRAAARRLLRLLVPA